MKKRVRLLSVFLAISLGFSLLANTYVSADDGFTISNGILQKYTGAQNSVTVPSGVTEIADSAFSGCTGVSGVTLPNSVSRIGKYAFYQCTNLKIVNLPDSVHTLDDGAFAGCTGLTSVTVPDSVTSFGSNLFAGDTAVLYGSNSSTAHQYATNNKINFREIGTKYPILTAPISGTGSVGVENAVKAAFSFVKKDMNEFEKAQVMHDYLVLNTKYDYANYTANTIPNDDYTAYGVLVKHTGVCAGYASAYSILMNLLGIPTLVMTSDTHAWNLVKLDGNWYHIDTTWDDPVPDRPGITAYDFFVLSDNKIKTFADHESWSTSAPAALDTKFDNYFWGAYTHEDFNVLETPVISTVTLDTSSYKNQVGTSYKFLAKTNIGELIYAQAADSSIVQVGNPEADEANNGWLIPIKGLKSGTTTVTAISASGATASFPVTFTNNFTSDTNGSFSVLRGNTYTFMITAPSRPTFACGSGSFKLISSSSSGNHYFFKVQATGTTGQNSGFYVNGAFVASAEITAPPAYSDTNGTFSITAGNTYQFMITSSAQPSFACGSGSFKVVSSSQSGNRYYYIVQAIGSTGDGCGFYVNGKAVAIGNIIAPVSSSDTTGTFSVKQGKTYQFMITSSGRPSFACGSGSFKLVSSSSFGNQYYYRVQAVGKVGDASGIYLNGKRIAVADVI